MKRAVSQTSIRQPARKRHQTFEPPALPAEQFPHFKTGTVEIILSEDEQDYQYNLHRSVLERNSEWFRTSFLNLLSDMPEPRFAYTTKFHYELSDATGTEEPLLARSVEHARETSRSVHVLDESDEGIAESGHRQQSDQAAPTPSGLRHNMTFPAAISGIPNGPNQLLRIKEEPSTNGTGTATVMLEEPTAEEPSTSQERTTKRLEAYNNLFLTFYNLPPRLCNDSISTALEQTEALIALARLFSSLPAIRAHVGNILTQYRRSLYSAIAENPLRWIHIGTAIESSVIFTEAVIHLAGSWPAWPWELPRTPGIEMTPPKIMALIKHKAQNLARLRAEVDRDLLLGTVPDQRCERAVDPSAQKHLTLAAKDAMDRYHNWYARELISARSAGTEHHACLYRLLKIGGDAYLPYDPKSGWHGVRKGLDGLKKEASQMVTHLCRNNLMLDSAELDVDYLTCTEVENHEMPWMGQAGS